MRPPPPPPPHPGVGGGGGPRGGGAARGGGRCVPEQVQLGGRRAVLCPGTGAAGGGGARCPGTGAAGGLVARKRRWGCFTLCSVPRFEDLPVTSLLRRDSVFPASAAHSGVSQGQETLPCRVSTFFRVFLLQRARNKAGLLGGVLLSGTRIF